MPTPSEQPETVKVVNTTKGDLSFGDRITIPKNGFAHVPVTELEAHRNHPAVNAWFNEGKLVFEEGGVELEEIDVDALLAEAEELGLKVDGRWKPERLATEVENYRLVKEAAAAGAGPNPEGDGKSPDAAS